MCFTYEYVIKKVRYSEKNYMGYIFTPKVKKKKMKRKKIHVKKETVNFDHQKMKNIQIC